MRMLLVLLLLVSAALARPGPQWASIDPVISRWFSSLMQPDNPAQSCCGVADAFESDIFETEGDHYVAVITDTRGILPQGTKFPVPNQKINWGNGNPTGHGYVFLSGAVPVSQQNNPGTVYILIDGGVGRILYCYVPPSGV